MYKIIRENLKKNYTYYNIIKDYNNNILSKDLVYQIDDKLIDDALSFAKSKQLDSYIDIIFCSRKYIESMLIKKCIDDIDFQILLLEKHKNIIVLVTHKFPFLNDEVNKIYEDAFEKCLNDYDSNKTLRENILKYMLIDIKNKYNLYEPKKESNEPKEVIEDDQNNEESYEYFDIAVNLKKFLDDFNINYYVFSKYINMDIEVLCSCLNNEDDFIEDEIENIFDLFNVTNKEELFDAFKNNIDKNKMLQQLKLESSLYNAYENFKNQEEKKINITDYINEDILNFIFENENASIEERQIIILLYNHNLDKNSIRVVCKRFKKNKNEVIKIYKKYLYICKEYLFKNFEEAKKLQFK